MGKQFTGLGGSLTDWGSSFKGVVFTVGGSLTGLGGSLTGLGGSLTDWESSFAGLGPESKVRVTDSGRSDSPERIRLSEI